MYWKHRCEPCRRKSWVHVMVRLRGVRRDDQGFQASLTSSDGLSQTNKTKKRTDRMAQLKVLVAQPVDLRWILRIHLVGQN